jgi:[histone H3]-lysine36 N-dimethyltransferase SETMAR
MVKQLDDFVKGAIFACYKNNMRVKDALNFVTNAYPECNLNERQLYWWYDEYKKGRDDPGRKVGSGRPVDPDKVTHLQNVEEAIKDNPFVSIRELVDILEIPFETIRMLIQELGYSKRSCRWVPRRLTEQQKIDRLEAARENLALLKSGDLLYSDIITLDEKQFRRYARRGRSASLAWQKPGESRIALPKAMSGSSQTSRLFCLAMSSVGVQHVFRVPQKTTVNANLYLDQCLLPAIEKAKTTCKHRIISVLHDNARPHVARVVTEGLAMAGVRVLRHPAYSPDISPCDYFLFSKLTKKLAGTVFNSEDDLLEGMHNAINQIPAEKFKSAMMQWEERLQLIVQSGEIILMRVSWISDSNIFR